MNSIEMGAAEVTPTASASAAASAPSTAAASTSSLPVFKSDATPKVIGTLLGAAAFGLVALMI